MQVDPIEPTLIAPGTEHLKLEHDKLLPKIAFNFNLRRYNEIELAARREMEGSNRGGRNMGQFDTMTTMTAKVGWCSLTLSNPR